MKTNSDMLLDEINRLFLAFPSGANEQQAAMYVRVLRTEAVSAERLARVVDSLEKSWERRTPPAVAELLRACRGSRGAADAAANEVRSREQAMMRDHLSRLCDHDAHAFQAAYGVWPDRSLYDRMGVTPPAGMTFRVLPRAECDAQRKAALDACRAAFARYRTAKRDPLVAPLAPVTVARKAELREQLGQLDLADLAHSNEPEPETREETISLDAWDGPAYGDEPLWDEEAA